MDQFNILLVAILSYIGYVLREIPSKIFDYILLCVSFSFTTTTRDKETYYAVNQWLFSLNKPILNNNVNARKEYESYNEVTKFSINYGDYIFFYKGSLIYLSKSRVENTFEYIDTIFLRVIGNHKRVKSEIFEMIRKADKDDSLWLYPLPEIWERFSMSKKSFSDVFIKDKDLIIQHLDKWLSHRELYKSHGIVYKTGILLYGSPGTGKTTTARAIASYLNFGLHVINVKSYEKEEKLIERIINIPEKSVILFEDIDCIVKNRSEKSENDWLLGLLLNILDGTMSPDNVVFVATTNHLDRLDPALIRDGRFDLRIEMNGIDRSLAEEMCRRYNIDPSHILLNEDFPINPTYLQNKIFKHLRL